MDLDLLDIFEELNTIYDENELTERVVTLNANTTVENTAEVSNDEFEKKWRELNIPETACVMTTEDFNKMMKKVEQFRW